MRSINKVIIIGNLTRNAELKETTGGQPIATFGLATNRQWVTRDSEKHSSAEFHECVAWGKLAEICSQFLTKGKLIYVEGHLKTRSWDNEDGTKKYKTEIVVNDMIMLEKRGDSDSESEEMVPEVQEATEASEQTTEVGEFDEFKSDPDESK